MKHVSIQTDNACDEQKPSENQDSWNKESTSVEEMVKEAAEDAMKQTGFVYEATSGLYYDYNTGYYYNAVNIRIRQVSSFEPRIKIFFLSSRNWACITMVILALITIMIKKITSFNSIPKLRYRRQILRSHQRMITSEVLRLENEKKGKLQKRK